MGFLGYLLQVRGSMSLVLVGSWPWRAAPMPLASLAMWQDPRDPWFVVVEVVSRLGGLGWVLGV